MLYQEREAILRTMILRPSVLMTSMSDPDSMKPVSATMSQVFGSPLISTLPEGRRSVRALPCRPRYCEASCPAIWSLFCCVSTNPRPIGTLSKYFSQIPIISILAKRIDAATKARPDKPKDSSSWLEKLSMMAETSAIIPAKPRIIPGRMSSRQIRTMPARAKVMIKVMDLRFVNVDFDGINVKGRYELPNLPFSRGARQICGWMRAR